MYGDGEMENNQARGGRTSSVLEAKMEYLKFLNRKIWVCNSNKNLNFYHYSTAQDCVEMYNSQARDGRTTSVLDAEKWANGWNDRQCDCQNLVICEKP